MLANNVSAKLCERRHAKRIKKAMDTCILGIDEIPPAVPNAEL